MVPTPVDFNSLQPFKAIRDNWSSLKPYHDNYIASVSFATILTAFLGTISLVIKHGFKMPRLHPSMEVEELQPTIKHPNQFISEQDLLDAKLFEFERRQQLEAWLESEDWLRELDVKAKTMGKEIKDEPGHKHPNVQAAEEEFRETAEGVVENAMDILENQGACDAESEPK